jgi:hypothetical protein
MELLEVFMCPTRNEKLQKLLTAEAVEIAKGIESKQPNTDKGSKERLPNINCDCGAEILLLPDLQAMNRAIKTHVNEHQKKAKNKNNVITYSNISQLLSQLSLRKINEQIDT